MGPQPQRPAILVLVFLFYFPPPRPPFFWQAVRQGVGETLLTPTPPAPGPASHPTHTQTHDCCGRALRRARLPISGRPGTPAAYNSSRYLDSLLYSLLVFLCNPPDPRPPERPGDKGPRRLRDRVRKEGGEGWKLCFVENYFCLYYCPL